MKHLLSTMSPTEITSSSRSACRRLIALPAFHDANAVMLYLPLPGEVDVTELALAAWRTGKTVLVPRVNWQQKHMMPIVCRSFDDEMTIGRHGLREPTDGHPWPIDEVDLIVVPALAFDRRGHRLGRGAGFYDRFLNEHGVTAATCGIAFAKQLVDVLPIREHDQPVDMLVTETEFLKFA